MSCGGPGFALTGFVVNECFAIDAGPLGTAGTPEELAAIEHIALTHSHIDHVGGLPVFLDTVYGLGQTVPTVHATAPTLDSLQRDVFNDRLMPDFIGMSTRMNPFLHIKTLASEDVQRIGKFTVSTFPVIHTVPTIAFLVDDGTAAVAFITDTAPVPALLRQLSAYPRLRAVFLEASFPNRLDSLAEVSRHLTSRQFAEAARMLPRSVKVYPIHIKPRFAAEIEREIEAERLPNLEFVQPGAAVEV
jgi:ribonuclease BN (tRNA processing enzyme)